MTFIKYFTFVRLKISEQIVFNSEKDLVLKIKTDTMVIWLEYLCTWELILSKTKESSDLFAFLSKQSFIDQV